MKMSCSAPQCFKMVEVSRIAHFKNRLYSLLNGGDFVSFVFCPEHAERMSNGTINDNDDTTNIDLKPLQDTIKHNKK